MPVDGRFAGPAAAILPGMDLEALRQDLVLDAGLPGGPLRLHTTWGLFSPRAVDAGSLLLLETLEREGIGPGTAALDIGCGYGPLGLSLARAAPAAEVHLVDRDFVAVDYAGANAARNGLTNARAYLSDGFSRVPADARFDLIVSNLPAKVGNELFRLLFADAHAHMRPGARFVVVTISGLKDFVKREFGATFGNFEKLRQGKSYTVSAARRE